MNPPMIGMRKVYCAAVAHSTNTVLLIFGVIDGDQYVSLSGMLFGFLGLANSAEHLSKRAQNER
ncbi:hypothetical protein ACFVYJ_01475 [Pontibacter sp. JAM-7]|uniref:hypothetical protein n=1 Tax=Pontibacter sp. JAM-7 TaxID=3366581 RepID=UPI003AF4596E